MPRQQRQTTAGQQTKKTIRVPLAGNGQQRATNEDKDQRFINYLIETTKNTVTDTKKLFCVKRPGSVLYSTPSPSAAGGRGVWYFNGAVWSIFGSTLYKGTVAKKTLSTSTGMCGAVEYVNQDDFGKRGLFIADGIDAWTIDSSDTVTRVDNKHLQWASNTIYEVGDRIVPTVLDTFYYTCTVSGTSGSSEPVWAATNTDGTGTLEWARSGTYTGPLRWVTGSYAVGDLVIPTTANENSFWYKITVAGTAVTEPATWPITIGSTVDADGITYECMGQYGGFPTPHIPTPVFMDGYIFLADNDSLDIYNSDTTNPYSWGALNWASAESYSDPVLGLARQNNFIAAFGTESTEFMYNYAKANQIPEGDFESPLDRHESMVLQTGILNRNAVLQAERLLVFIGDSLMGGHSVWRMDGSAAKEISTEYVEKFIDLEDTTTKITGFGIRIAGHMLFIVNLPTADKTFVYDVEENAWTEWQYNGGMLPFVYFCDANGTVVLQHSTDGKLYKLDPLVYNDFDADIEARIRLAKQDFDTDSYKFYHQITIIGDKPSGAYTLRWSDDDFTTWSNDKTLPITDRPYFMRAGKARRRAWEVEYNHNSASRLEALEITYSIGDH